MASSVSLCGLSYSQDYQCWDEIPLNAQLLASAKIAPFLGFCVNVNSGGQSREVVEDPGLEDKGDTAHKPLAVTRG